MGHEVRGTGESRGGGGDRRLPRAAEGDAGGGRKGGEKRAQAGEKCKALKGGGAGDCLAHAGGVEEGGRGGTQKALKVACPLKTSRYSICEVNSKSTENGDGVACSRRF